MANFTPNLEDSTEEQLNFSINQHDPNYASLASDELTRRSLAKLQESIKAFDSTTSDYTRRLIVLTVLLFIVAVIQLLVTAFALPFDLLNRVLIVASLGILLLWIIRDMTRD